jgi:colanic acid biosynthesis protein WcaH
VQEPKPGDWIPAADFAQVVRLTPLIAIDLIARLKDGRALLGRRTNEPAKGVLFVPGSRITKNETIAAAFERITREELGTPFSLNGTRFRGIFEHFYATNRFEKPGFGTHYITLAYELNLKEALRSLPQDQHGEYFWLRPEEILSRTDVHPNSKAYFRALA